jgi:hypothetical protein
VNSLIEGYLQQERTIILAVVPANQDVATIDILERAKKVDPEGDRTIGVLTKPDLIGPGNEEEALSVLNNVRKPLKLGYIMVKNRYEKQNAFLRKTDASLCDCDCKTTLIKPPKHKNNTRLLHNKFISDRNRI